MLGRRQHQTATSRPADDADHRIADGFAFVHGGADARPAGAVRLAHRLDGVRRQLESPRARHLHGRRRPLPAPPPRGLRGARLDGPISAQAAPAALPGARLQPAERRRRALVRAGRAETIGGGPSLHDDPGVLPVAVRRLAPAAARVAHRGPPVPNRGRPASRRPPTPEGLHRDGVDYVLVLLVDRQNIASGMTTIHALDGRALGHFTLTDPFDAALVDDTARRARRHAGQAHRPGAAGVPGRARRDVPPIVMGRVIPLSRSKCVPCVAPWKIEPEGSVVNSVGYMRPSLFAPILRIAGLRRVAVIRNDVVAVWNL